ncbi:MAG: LptF/LptG family permease [Alistipes sp.]|nr:LptF/LptG family permease [Alistipes sp.]
MKFKFPGIKILDRYIIRKFLGTYVFAIAFIIIIVVIFDAVEKIDDFIELKAPLKDIAMRYYLNFIPYFINQFSGLFTFIAVIFFTSKLAYQTEIIAILSSGVSFKRLMWPYFLSAMIITLLALSLNLFIIPKANERRIEFETEYLKKGRRMQRYDMHIYRQISPGTVAYIRGFRGGDNNNASYLAIEKYEDNKFVGALEAANPAFDPETRRWSAPRYITRVFDGENEFFEAHQALDTLINLEATELGRVEELIKTMNLFELNDFIGQQKEKGSDMIATFLVERTQRFSYPISTFILTLIGVSLSSRKVRGGTGLHIGIGITLCFSYILIAKFAEEFAKNGVLPPVLLVWLPNIFFAVIAVYLYKKAPK